jgi:hypothetical protein
MSDVKDAVVRWNNGKFFRQKIARSDVRSIETQSVPVAYYDDRIEVTWDATVGILDRSRYENATGHYRTHMRQYEMQYAEYQKALDRHREYPNTYTRPSAPSEPSPPMKEEYTDYYSKSGSSGRHAVEFYALSVEPELFHGESFNSIGHKIIEAAQTNREDDSRFVATKTATAIIGARVMSIGRTIAASDVEALNYDSTKLNAFRVRQLGEIEICSVDFHHVTYNFRGRNYHAYVAPWDHTIVVGGGPLDWRRVGGVAGTCAVAATIALATAHVTGHGYADKYGGDFKVMTSSAAIYTRPSNLAETCLGGAQEGENFDCAQKPCVTEDTVSGRWVEVDGPGDSPCWLNFSHLRYQRGWWATQLHDLGLNRGPTTEEEQAAALAVGHENYLRAVEAARGKSDVTELVFLAKEGRAAAVEVPETVAEALLKAESEEVHGKLMHRAASETNVSDRLWLLQQARALPYPNDKGAIEAAIDVVEAGRAAALLDRAVVKERSDDEVFAVWLELAAFNAEGWPKGFTAPAAGALCEALWPEMSQRLTALASQPARLLTVTDAFINRNQALLTTCDTKTQLVPKLRHAAREKLISEKLRALYTLSATDPGGALRATCALAPLEGDGVLLAENKTIQSWTARVQRQLVTSLGGLLAAATPPQLAKVAPIWEVTDKPLADWRSSLMAAPTDRPRVKDLTISSIQACGQRITADVNIIRSRELTSKLAIEFCHREGRKDHVVCSLPREANP